MKKIVLIIALLGITNLCAQSNIDFQKINESYINMTEYGFKGFSANVEFNLFEQFKKTVKDEKYLAMLNNTNFKLDFFNKDSVVFTANNFVSTDNEQLNEGVDKIISGAEQAAKGFFQTWSELTLTPALEPEKYHYKTETPGGISKLNYTQEGMDISIYLSNSINIDSTIMTNRESRLDIYPLYEMTSFNKKIIKSLLTKINKLIEVKMDIQYKDFDKIKIPESVSIYQKMPGMNQEVIFNFKNIVLR